MIFCINFSYLKFQKKNNVILISEKSLSTLKLGRKSHPKKVNGVIISLNKLKISVKIQIILIR